jgi:uncharacterized protein (TIGR02118 family)
LATLTVIYPNQPGGRFDERYYIDHHIALVRRLWGPMGLTDVRLLRGVGTLDGGSAPYRVIALVSFTSADALRQALASYSEEVFASIRKYTDIEPEMQVNEDLA